MCLAAQMTLSLFHVALPYLKPSAQKLRELKKVSLQSQTDDKQHKVCYSCVFLALGIDDTAKGGLSIFWGFLP